MDFKSFLTEMFLHPLGELSKGSYDFIAWRQHLWIGSYQDIERNSQLIYQQIISEHPRGDEITASSYRRDPEDIFNWIRENIADGLTGYFNPKTKQIEVTGDLSPTTSPLAAKVLQQLKAKTFEQEYSDERTIRYGQSTIQNRIPELVYQGTATKYFSGIVRFGLMPKPDQSNYRNIVHHEKTFLTASLPEAEQHAMHTARGGDEYIFSTKKHHIISKGLPMVVAVRIPNPAKLTPDMDVDRHASGTGYNHSYWFDKNDNPDKYYSVDSQRATMHAGLFGYEGRIPAKFINHLRIYAPYRKAWMRLTPDKFSKALARVMREGDDYWYTILGDPQEMYGQ